MIRPAAGAEAATDDPGVVVEEDGAAERLLMHERPELDLDAELLDRLTSRGILRRLPVLDPTTGEEVIGVTVTDPTDERHLAVLDEHDAGTRGQHAHSSRSD